MKKLFNLPNQPSNNNQSIQNAALDELANLKLSLRPKEIHAIISNNISELSNLWDNLCILKEHNQLSSDFFDYQAASTINSKEICLLTKLFPTLSAMENVFLFEGAFYTHRRLRLLSDFNSLISKYNLTIKPTALPKALSYEYNLILFLLRIYIHKPAILFIPHGVDLYIEGTQTDTFSRLINDIKSNGTCIVFFTSLYELAMLYSDKASVLRNNRIVTTENTVTIRRYPHDFLNLLMGWEFIGNSKDDKHLTIGTKTPDIKELTAFNADLKSTLQSMCSDILHITHASSCQILLTEQNFRIQKTSSFSDTAIDYRLSKDMIDKYLKAPNMQPFVLNQSDSDIINDNQHCTGSFVCIPIKIIHGTSGIILIAYKNPISELDEHNHNLLFSFAREVSIFIETSILIGRSSLVQESHHRIKNSLQTIVSLVTLEKERFTAEGKTQEAVVLSTIILRIKAIAKVHDLLSMQSSNSSLMDLSSILSNIADSYRSMATLNFNLSSTIIPYNKALSIALMVNELLNNSVKHSGIDPKALEISISCYQDDNTIHLSVADNGIGFPSDFETVKHNSIGYDIITSIVQSLSGKISFSYDHGAKSEISFPQSAMYII